MMDLDLTKEQKILKNSARDFLKKECPRSLIREMNDDKKGFPREMWDQMAELGWLGVAIPEKYGGYGGTFLDVCILLETIGEFCCPAPFFSTVVTGALPILFVGDEEQKESLLPKIARGDLIVAFAMAEPDVWYDVTEVGMTAVESGDTFILNGTKLFVENAQAADYILCVARTNDDKTSDEGLTLFMVDANTPGLERTSLKCLTYDKQCEVVFDQVAVPKSSVIGDVHQSLPVLKKLQDHAAVAKCAEMLGGMQAAFDMTVAYAKERKQFGRPIGSFQAVQHHCANMLIDVDGSRFITYYAAWKISEGQEAGMDASMAKAWTSSASRRVTLLAHQVHGAISFCEEYDIHLFYRRAKSGEIAFGDSDFHLKTVAGGLGLP